MRRIMKQSPDQLRIVLVGKTGSGKSSSGNTILGEDREETFKEGFSPVGVTMSCQSEYTEVDGKQINVIDTVGLADKPVPDVQFKIEQIFETAHDGVDVFLFVIKLGNRYTEEKENTVKFIQKILGANSLKYTIVLFTHGDQLHVPVKEYFARCISLKKVVDECSGRYHVFNNQVEDPDQVTDLLERIEKLRVRNKGVKYTEQYYRETQKDILYKRCAAGAAMGVVGVAVASNIGALALTAGKFITIGAAGGVAVAIAAGAVMFYFSRNEDY